MGNIWKKGALHTHTFWSDANNLPEMIIHTYRDELKYDFVCITEHNFFADKSMLYPVIRDRGPWPPQMSYEELNRSIALLGNQIEHCRISSRRYVRLKSFDELQRDWQIPGKFQLIGGCELTTTWLKNGESHDIHLNAINCHRTIVPPIGDDGEKTMQACIDLYREACAGETHSSLLICNHPFWRYWDVDPRLLIAHPELKFMEICNNSDGINASDGIFTVDRYWDFVLAHRLDRGDGIIYTVAVDDVHYGEPDKHHANGGFDNGWVMVKCPGEMTTGKLISAMNNGDFYSSCGVYFDTISFDPATRTLQVRIQAKPGQNYRIMFIVTRRDFDRQITEKYYPHENPEHSRTLPVIPDSVGICAEMVEGIEGSYTMTDDDLYVRAVAVADAPGYITGVFYPETQRAWTQPFQ